MEVLSIRRINLEFSDLASRRPLEIPAEPLARSPGIHLSDILKHIGRKIGKLKPGERLEEDYPWRMAMGNMWEEFYFSLHPSYLWQPGEQVIDGVAMNADGLRLGPAALIDTKCTECKVVGTAEELEEKFSYNWWVYGHQARGYCHGYEVDTFVWPVLHYRGDWRGSGPVVMEYEVRFSPVEILQTWEMVMRFKEEVEEEGLL